MSGLDLVAIRAMANRALESGDEMHPSQVIALCDELEDARIRSNESFIVARDAVGQAYEAEAKAAREIAEYVISLSRQAWQPHAVQLATQIADQIRAGMWRSSE